MYWFKNYVGTYVWSILTLILGINTLLVYGCTVDFIIIIHVSTQEDCLLKTLDIVVDPLTKFNYYSETKLPNYHCYNNQ